MKYITLRVPGPFSTGPQFDEDGELINGSWPAGLPYEGIKGWVNLGEKSGGLSLCEYVAPDNYPIGDIPGGWRANASYIWDGVTQHGYDENGDLIGNAYDIELATDESDYMGHFPEDTEYKRHHSYLGWPAIV